MKNNKTDHRTKLTRLMIKNSLMKLIENKPMKKITVTEICDDAEITRGTFYNHFYDVFDVYENIEDEFFNEIKVRLEVKRAYDLDSSFFKEIVSFVSQYSNLVVRIILKTEGSLLIKKIIEYVKNKYVAEYMEKYPALSKKIIEKVFTYTINGAIAIIIEWLKEDQPETEEEIAKLIEKMNAVMVSGLLNDYAKFK